MRTKEIILIFAAVIILLVLIHLAMVSEQRSGGAGGTTAPYSAPNPFPNLPQVQVSSSSGAMAPTKTDYRSNEEPVIKIDLNKLP